MASSSSSITAEDDEAEGGGRPRSYDWARPEDEMAGSGDLFAVCGRERARSRSSSVMRGRSTPQCFIIYSSVSSLSWISAVSGKSRRGISFGNRSFLSSGLLIGMFNTAF